MSLIKCIRKAGKFLSQDDKDAILAKAAEYRDQGLKAGEAGKRAVQDQLTSLRSEMESPKAAATEQAPPSKPAGEGEAPSLDQQLATRLAAEKPDMEVILPGTEERITVAEAMKRIAEVQQQDGQWADLVKVAAECALAGAA